MAFASVKDRQKPKRKKSFGKVVKAKTYDGFYLQVDPDCELILYAKDTGEYFKVSRVPVKPANEDDDSYLLFSAIVDLESPTQVELVGKD